MNSVFVSRDAPQQDASARQCVILTPTCVIKTDATQNYKLYTPRTKNSDALNQSGHIFIQFFSQLLSGHFSMHIISCILRCLKQ
jgi:hypothetical protein